MVRTTDCDTYCVFERFPAPHSGQLQKVNLPHNAGQLGPGAILLLNYLLLNYFELLTYFQRRELVLTKSS